MLFSLHGGILHEIPLPAIVLEEYYAVDYLNKYIDAKSHAFGVRLTLFDPISRNHAIQTKYHSFFLNTTTRGKFFN